MHIEQVYKHWNNQIFVDILKFCVLFSLWKKMLQEHEIYQFPLLWNKYRLLISTADKSSKII